MGGADLDARLQQAIKAFKKQLADLRTLRGSYTQDPNFIRWRNTTTEVFKHFLPESESFSRFLGTTFEGGYFEAPTYPDDPRSPFNRGLTAAGACVESAIEYLEIFGLEAGVPEQRVATSSAVGGDASVVAESQGSSMISEILKGIDQLREELTQVLHSFRSDESLREAKLKTWARRVYEQLKDWGFSVEAEQGFGRNSIINLHEGVDARAKLRDDNLRALRDDVASHPEHYKSKIAAQPETTGRKSVSIGQDKIFLGHGRSLLWHRVERYLEKDKKLRVEAWESVSHSGEQVVAVLEGLLNSCTFAVLVVTGEDEMAQGPVRARQNVVHEIGLFQGRLGFRRVALLEQWGTESFSNIDGLQTIPFPDQTIEASFPELERMLKREGVIK